LRFASGFLNLFVCRKIQPTTLPATACRDGHEGE